MAREVEQSLRRVVLRPLVRRITDPHLRQFLSRARGRARRRPLASIVLSAVSVAMGSWFVVIWLVGTPPASGQSAVASLRDDPSAYSSDPQLANLDPATTIPVQTTLPAPTLPTATTVPVSDPTSTSTTTAPVETTIPPSSTSSTAAQSSSPVVSGTSGQVAQIAASIITSVDRLSGGRYKIPANSHNIALMESWMANEGGLWANNPLNSDLYASKYSHQFNGSQDTGTPIYPSMTVGIQAAAETLLGNPAYTSILAALSSGSVNCVTFADAVIDSPWAASHYEYDPARFCSGDVPTLQLPAGQGRGHGHDRGHGIGAAPRKPTPRKQG